MNCTPVRDQSFRPARFVAPDCDKMSAITAAFGTPKTYFPVIRDKENERVNVHLTPGSKSQMDAIYKFRRKSDGASYIGMATNVQKRLSSHLSAVNNQGSEAGKSKLASAIRINPDDFEFGLIATKAQIDAMGISVELDELEKMYITSQKIKGKVFNTRAGGGGGTSKKSKAVTSQEKVNKAVAKLYRTPDKSYAVDPRSYKVLLSPSDKVSEQLYIIKRKHTVNDEEVNKRYIGRTGRRRSARLAEHSHFARHPEKIKSQKSELYRDMHAYPEQFSVKILDPKEFDGEDGSQDIDQLETGLIEYFANQDTTSKKVDEVLKPVYNKNRGGGGSYPQQKRKR